MQQCGAADLCPDDPDLYAEAGEIAATKHALEKAIALFVKKNNLHLAAVSCVDLAEFYMEHQLLHNALDSYEQAADYYSTNGRRNRYCRFQANLLRFTLANKEMLHVKGMLPIKDYKRSTTNISSHQVLFARPVQFN